MLLVFFCPRLVSRNAGRIAAILVSSTIGKALPRPRLERSSNREAAATHFFRSHHFTLVKFHLCFFSWWRPRKEKEKKKRKTGVLLQYIYDTTPAGNVISVRALKRISNGDYVPGQNGTCGRYSGIPGYPNPAVLVKLGQIPGYSQRICPT